MNDVTTIIDSFWKEGYSLQNVYEDLKRKLAEISPAVAGVIGRELLLRIKSLSTPEFATAAFLATEGEAGNDSLIDFVDCVSILPEGRYLRILETYDTLIDDPVTHQFDEFGFYNLFESRFESAFDVTTTGLLRHLVRGIAESELPTDHIRSSNIDAAKLFPNLFLRYGHVLNRTSTLDSFTDKVTLRDFLE